jgi:ribose transport system substrate-binding protein
MTLMKLEERSMKKSHLARLGLATLLAGAVFGGLTPASAKTFAVVVKTVNDVFSAPIKEGCEAAAKELGDTCYYIGPSQVDEGQQIQVVNDVISKGIDGLAVSATNPKSMARILARLKDRNIPTVTFDGDLLPDDAKYRSAFIGTDNYQFGVELAKKVVELKPHGGSVCIQTGTAGSLNLELRVQGVRDTLGGGSKDKPIKRLTGQNGWTEPGSCPVYNNDNISLSAQQLNDVLTANPKLDAFVAVGGWAQYAPAAYRAAVGRVKDRVDSKDLVISFGDAFAPQMPLLKDGLSHYQVGQSPYQMGYQAIKALDALSKGQTIPAYIDTGFVKCTPDMADTCGKN